MFSQIIDQMEHKNKQTWCYKPHPIVHYTLSKDNIFNMKQRFSFKERNHIPKHLCWLHWTTDNLKNQQTRISQDFEAI